VEHGADINKEDNYSFTPLFWSCQEGHISIVKYLVEHGANVNEESISGNTPLSYACQNGHINIVKYLM